MAREKLGNCLAHVRIPAFTVPSPLARISAHLPQLPPTLALVIALNQVPETVLPRATLAPLDGRHLRVCVLDAGLSLDFTLCGERFRPCRAHATPPDLVISATARDFLALAWREEDADTLFFARRLTMTGDTELGLLVKNTLDAIDWRAGSR
ncbi:MAG: SCP2 sterol-binding domain-containing protein [Azoarcus sp.]|nr:SCP2 sterol-binding domain-containing protein [Azoarcus sp.]